MDNAADMEARVRNRSREKASRLGGADRDQER